MPEKDSTPSQIKAPRERKKLTKAQERLARAVVKNPDAGNGMLADKTGYSDGEHVRRALKLPHVQERIQHLMESHPATCPEGLHKKLVEGLDAQETKFFSFEGEVTDTRTVIDFNTRHKYLETAAEWAGISEKRVKISQDEAAPLSLEMAVKVLAILSSETPQPPPAIDVKDVEPNQE